MGRRSTVPEQHRCEAGVQPMSWNGNDPRCQCYSSIYIGGKKLCGKHAAMAALRIAMKARSAKLIQRPRTVGTTSPWVLKYLVEDECPAPLQKVNP